MSLTSPGKFYLAYLRGCRGSRNPSEAMELGSVFDGYVKMYLCKQLYGQNSDWESYNNIRPETPDSVLKAAAFVFQTYLKDGEFNALLAELNNSATPPKFEFELHNTINGIPLKGFPDLFFTTEEGTLVIYDWKVNGYFGSTTTSPTKGYISYGGQPHKSVNLATKAGIGINTNPISKREWMNQLTIYSWLLGNPVGEENHVLGIDQIVCNPPKIRTARHRSFSKKSYQLELFNSLKSTWLKVTDPTWLAEMESEYGDIAEAYDASAYWDYLLSITFQYRGLPSL